MTTAITPEIRAKMIKRIVQVLITTLVQAVVLFLAAGTLRWDWGWVYIGTFLLGILVNGVMLFRANPLVIAERADKEGAQGWDLLWGGIAYIVIMAGIPVFGGLDFRFDWTPDVGLIWHFVGLGSFLIGSLLFGWAMAYNAKFATIVRVGEEGTHPVAMDGPYRIVRHPGYLGFCFQSIGLPLLFGSWWGYILSVVGIIAVIIRTSLEDRTLQAELTGYDRLVVQTRYRLFPGIW